MSLLTEVKGWTPVLDSLTKEHGLITAAVYGVVWRYCQMEDMPDCAVEGCDEKGVELHHDDGR